MDILHIKVAEITEIAWGKQYKKVTVPKLDLMPTTAGKTSIEI